MSNSKEISVDLLRSLFDYDPVTGILRWRVDRPNGIRVGDIAGNRWSKDRPYLRVEIDGRAFAVHRIAWALMTGAWPKEFIDHINGVENNNRWENLREADRSQNAANSRLYRSNKSGYRGVSYDKHHRKWVAQIHISKGKNTRIGRFDTKEEAVEAYRKVAIEIFGDFLRAI